MINTCPIYGACRVTITSGSPTEICGLHGLTKHKGLRPKHGGAQSTKDWRMLKGIDQNIDQNDSKWPALRFEIFASMFSNIKVVHPSQKRSRVYDPFVSMCLFGIAIKKQYKNWWSAGVPLQIWHHQVGQRMQNLVNNCKTDCTHPPQVCKDSRNCRVSW